jgi:DNA-binding NtrC family response regulator
MENLAVLIVEGDARFARDLGCVLKFEGCLVHAVSNARDAFQALVRYPVQVILSDLLLEQETGSEFFRAVADDVRFGHIKGVLMTDLDRQLAIMHMRKMTLSNVPILTKPFHMKDLACAIEAAVPLGVVKRVRPPSGRFPRLPRAI